MTILSYLLFENWCVGRKQDVIIILASRSSLNGMFSMVNILVADKRKFSCSGSLFENRNELVTVYRR